LGGLSLADLLAAQATAGSPGRDTSVILFWMWGGPSQLDTYDLKPQASAEYRGPFRPIHANVPGLDICELFPLQASLGNKMALVRSLHHTMSAHADGGITVLTGKPPSKPDPSSQAVSEHPAFGMVVSRLCGTQPDGLRRYVGIPQPPPMTKPNYLGLSCRGFDAGDPSQPAYWPPNLRLAAGTNGERLGDRRGLLQQFDRIRREVELRGELEGADRFRDRALQMLTSWRTASAFDIQKEEPRLRDRYGRHLWGQSCLLARHLAEAGVPVVTVDATAPAKRPTGPGFGSWDDHAVSWDLAAAMRWRAPYLDQAISGGLPSGVRPAAHRARGGVECRAVGQAGTPVPGSKTPAAAGPAQGARQPVSHADVLE
jgi:hypothetical protein